MDGGISDDQVDWAVVNPESLSSGNVLLAGYPAAPMSNPKSRTQNAVYLGDVTGNRNNTSTRNPAL
jgi:hypothetical protein